MLPFKNRLSKRKDFDRVQKEGQFFSEANIAVKMAKNGLPETRVGFVASLKFSKKAVERNQAKRLLREISKKELPKLKNGFDVVIMIRKRPDERIVREQLEKNMVAVLQKSGLIK